MADAEALDAVAGHPLGQRLRPRLRDAGTDGGRRGDEIKAAVVVTSDQTRSAVRDVIRRCLLESGFLPRGSARRGGRARGSVRA
jgi:hypothetical protein